MKNNRLIQLALASSLLMSSVAYAACTIILGVAGPVTTSSCGGYIEVNVFGSIASLSDGIQVDSANATVQIDDALTPILGINAGIYDINIENAGTNATIYVGQNRQMSAPTAIHVDASGANITNADDISSSNQVILVTASGSGLTLTNNSTATLNATGGAPAVQLGADFTNITNHGTISAANSDGIQNTLAGASTGTITNYGTITSNASGAGIEFLNGDYTGTITNSGTIEALGSFSSGIYFYGTGNVTNSGFIFDTGTLGIGIQYGGSGSSGGSIQNVNNGIIESISGIAILSNQLGLSITNSGNAFITSASGEAIKITKDFTSINNSGQFISTTSGTNAIEITVASTGNITTSSLIRNAGPTGVNAMSFGGDYSGTLTNTGTIDTYGTGAAILMNGAVGTITNSGTIAGHGTGAYAFNLLGLGSPGGSITNSGSISSDSGIAILSNQAGLVFTNSGLVTTFTTNDAIKITNNFSSITNSGTITSPGGTGAIEITTATSGNITNSGTIQNTGTSGTNHYAIDFEGNYTGTLTNNSGATITSSAPSGATIYMIGGVGTVINSGFITSTVSSSPAILLQGATSQHGGSVTNNTSGIITSPGIAFLDAQTGVTISNAGTISSTGGSSDALYVTADFASINNSGTITTNGGNAVEINAAATGNITNSNQITNTSTTVGNGVLFDTNYAGTLTNTSTGTISTKAFGYTALFAVANPGTIVNSGNILALGASSTGIYLQGTGTAGGTITNNSSGTISGTLGINDNQLGLTLVNAGMIEGLSNIGLYVNNNFTSINNQVGGTIAGNTASAGALTLNVATNGGIQNSGTITNTLGPAVDIIGAYTGTFVNNVSGKLLSSASAGEVLLFGNNFGTFVNYGNIQASNAGVEGIVSTGGSVGDIYNYGDITVVSSKAIDLSANGKTTFTQIQGTITGDVMLAGYGNAAPTEQFRMEGGTINGNVTAQSTTNNILQLVGGTITGTTTLGSKGDIINFDGTIANAIVGGTGTDTYNYERGSFTTLDGKGGGDTLNIFESYTTLGAITNVDNIHVQMPGTKFTNNFTITQLNGLLTIDPMSVMVVNANVSGSGAINNAGSLTINNGFNVNMGGAVVNTGTLTLNSDFITPSDLTASTFTQNAGTLVIPFIDINHHGSITVTTSAALNAGTVYATFAPPGFLPQGLAVPIIFGPGPGTMTVNPAVNEAPPISAVLRFIVETDALRQNIDLVVERTPYAVIANNTAEEGVAQTLDGLVNILDAGGVIDPDLFNVINFLDTLQTDQQVVNALAQLTPDTSYALIESAHIGMDRTFDSIWYRLEDIRRVSPDWVYEQMKSDEYYSGYSAGDGNLCPYGIWVKGLGEWLNQRDRKGFYGYRANAEGVAVGFDRTFLPNTTLGFAGSYTQVRVVEKNPTDNVQNVGSGQATLYGYFQPTDTIYVDAMLGAALNKFRQNRNIAMGNINMSAFSSFYGWQVGGQADIGYVDWEDPFYIVPIARMKITYLSLPDYNEKEAGGLNLSVSSQNYTQAMLGGGVRFARRYPGMEYCYLPEISLLALYDFADQREQTVANFLGGGAAFQTNGVKPSPEVFLIDLGVDVFKVDQLGTVFRARYELELRDRFVGNSGFVEMYYRWL